MKTQILSINSDVSLGNKAQLSRLSSSSKCIEIEINGINTKKTSGYRNGLQSAAQTLFLNGALLTRKHNSDAMVGDASQFSVF